MTRNQIADRLATIRGLREVPSETSLSSILAKNVQLRIVGSEVVERADGIKTKHSIFDINRDIIQSEDDIIYTRPPSCMTALEKKSVERCSCGRYRIIPEGSDVCLHCIRASGS